MNLTEIKNRFVGISCAHVDGSGNVDTKCYGLSDMEDNKAVDENTIFPACSISKFVTAFCIMRLNEQGLIDIDKPVNDYLKDW
ncbi:MAG: beta-lactamase family protein, partial [Lachnospiraceae bacterium]|nr:beta-lactamase family protein [Lachnospiraceae bacterium]